MAELEYVLGIGVSGAVPNCGDAAGLCLRHFTPRNPEPRQLSTQAL